MFKARLVVRVYAERFLLFFGVFFVIVRRFVTDYECVIRNELDLGTRLKFKWMFDEF